VAINAIVPTTLLIDDNKKVTAAKITIKIYPSLCIAFVQSL
jgi:hypothetical protein